ncbi:MAG: hypothetical protein ABI995_14435, partial [Acidobacteriota bacterium]
TGLALAVNPSFLNMTVFDNGAVAATMAALGLGCAALSTYIRRNTVRAAFWLGAAAGFGVWTRANFLWTLVAFGVAVAIVAGRSLARPWQHWVGLGAGGILGSLPFLVYQWVSGGGTFQAMGLTELQATGTWSQLLLFRLRLLAEVLIADTEHTVIWGPSRLPLWQMWIFPLFLVVAVGACLMWGTKIARATAVALLVLIGLLFASRITIAEHHLIAVVPLAVFVAVLGGMILRERLPGGSILIGAMALIYVGSAVFWQVSEIRGLRSTGGLGVWSDAANEAARVTKEKAGDREVKVVDWGLSESLFVLSDAGIRVTDIFWPEMPTVSINKLSWADEIRTGGLFMISGSENRQFAPHVHEFLNALNSGRPVIENRTTISTRRGTTYAQLIDIRPNSLGQGSGGTLPEQFEIQMSDVSREKLLSGFYGLEASGWRWSGPKFSAIVGPVDTTAGDPWLHLSIYVAEASIQRLKQFRLTAKVGSTPLAPETFQNFGEFTYSRRLDPAWFANGPANVEFELDKWLPASKDDSRELGIIVKSITISPQ